MFLKLQKHQNKNNENLHYLFLRRRFVVRLSLNFRIKFNVRSNFFLKIIDYISSFNLFI